MPYHESNQPIGSRIECTAAEVNSTHAGHQIEFQIGSVIAYGTLENMWASAGGLMVHLVMDGQEFVVHHTKPVAVTITRRMPQRPDSVQDDTTPPPAIVDMNF